MFTSLGTENQSSLLATIERSKQQWEATFDSTSDLIFMRDAGGTAIKINRAFAEVFGAAPRNLVGLPLRGLEVTRHGDVLEGPRIQIGEQQPIALPGTYMISKSQVSDYDTGGMAEVVVLRDITVLNQMEATLREAEKAASIQALAAGVAHEIRNPLTIISGRVEMLLGEADLVPEVRTTLEIIRTQAERVAQLTKTLTQLATPGTFLKARVNIETVIDEVLCLMGYELSRNRIRLIRRSTALPEIEINYSQFVQVFINLFANARDAMPEGGVLTVETRCFKRDGGDCVRVSVSDTGAGIDPDKTGKIFLPFFTTKPTGKGTGLGLAVTQAIIREHAGEIRVDSSPGHGATFHVELDVDAAKKLAAR